MEFGTILVSAFVTTFAFVGIMYFLLMNSSPEA
jgi:hypothetical protein